VAQTQRRVKAFTPIMSSSWVPECWFLVFLEWRSIVFSRLNPAGSLPSSSWHFVGLRPLFFSFSSCRSIPPFIMGPRTSGSQPDLSSTVRLSLLNALVVSLLIKLSPFLTFLDDRRADLFRLCPCSVPVNPPFYCFLLSDSCSYPIAFLFPSSFFPSLYLPPPFPKTRLFFMTLCCVGAAADFPSLIFMAVVMGGFFSFTGRRLMICFPLRNSFPSLHPDALSLPWKFSAVF